jgi:uncharacterized protein
VTGLTDDRYFMSASPARPGDYLEFFAEIDLLCALSACPGGDLSVDLWGPQAADPLPACKPLGVEVYDVDPLLLDRWDPPPAAPTTATRSIRPPKTRSSRRARGHFHDREQFVANSGRNCTRS